MPDKEHHFKYKVVIFDEVIPVCEVRYNDEDMANFIGSQLTNFIASIQNPIPDSYTESHYNYNEDEWAGRNYREVPPED